MAGVARNSLNILDPPQRKAYLEREIAAHFGFRSARILQRPEGAERFSAESTRVRDILTRIIGILDGTGRPFLNPAVCEELRVSALLRRIESTHAFPISRGADKLGILVVDAGPGMRLEAATEESLLALCGHLAVVLENSNLLRAKLELQHALQRQAQMAQLGEMTARIAHEIKNPLSAIKTIVQVLLEDPEMSSRFSRDLDLIKGEVDRLSESVVRLLDFARPVPQPEKEVRLREAADSAIGFLARDIQALGASVHNEIARDVPAVAGDASLFREIFLNLLLNAFQAGGAGTRVRILAREIQLEGESEKFVRLEVEDNGPGIPTGLQPEIFTPFFTTKLHGIGLGLAVVKRNVEHLGGEILVESPAQGGRGARFVLHLPKYREGAS